MDIQITQFLESQGFMDYLERCIMSEDSSNNLLDKLQDATGRGQNPTTIFPSQSVEPEIITVAEPDVGDAVNLCHSEPGSRHCYKQFPSTVRTEEQEEKRRSILALASGAHSGRQNPSSPMLANGDSKAESLSSMERAAERELMVLDIKVKLQVTS
ncbi:hypothetical protein BHM03_00018673 [Ensete ventricosum]|uniref:Uncharacterized protein n=1 Tax=Ensete ventricosum TaxID=4639 RepID=A0A445MFE6_ENSVE|nr:hypothetical protein BHM03_00018673 [Ensete ventricosum]